MYTDEELIAEMARRKAEYLQKAKALSVDSSASGEYPRKSEAKRQMWSAWHVYKREHPEATVAEWRKAHKRGKR
jgi:hypothetical protein